MDSKILKPTLMFNPPIIAHRGASALAPENTFAAFRKAKEIGAKWVEFDVMLTRDHEAVVIHDEKLDRTTGKRGYVKSFLYSDIKILDAGSWFSPDFSQERIPTLKEIIELLNQLQLSANIEIKAQKGREEKTVETVLRIVNENWKNQTSQLLISSFSFPILKHVRKISSNSMIGFLIDKWNNNWEKKCDELQAAAVDINHKILNPERVKQIKDTGRQVLSYTVNDTRLAYKLLSWGVDAIFSDCPEKILEIIS